MPLINRNPRITNSDIKAAAETIANAAVGSHPDDLWGEVSAEAEDQIRDLLKRAGWSG
jgi:hypothetical protein